MKRKLPLIALIALWSIVPMFAQEKIAAEDIPYRRSSLHTILLETGDFLNKEMVMNSYNMAPFPDKYNDHRIEGSIIRLNEYAQLDSAEMAVLSDSAMAANGDKEKTSKREALQTQAIENYFQKNKIANKLVAKWFGRDENGGFKMDLIHERGSYDATEMAAPSAAPQSCSSS
jgi:hypothetical protein